MKLLETLLDRCEFSWKETAAGVISSNSVQ